MLRGMTRKNPGVWHHPPFATYSAYTILLDRRCKAAMVPPPGLAPTCFPSAPPRREPGPISAERWAKISQARRRVLQQRSTSPQIRPNFGGCPRKLWPTLSEFVQNQPSLAKVGQISALHRWKSSQSWSVDLEPNPSMQTKVDPNLVSFGSNLTDIDGTYPRFGQIWPELGRLRPPSSQVRPMSASIRPNLGDPRKLGPDFGEHGPAFRELARLCSEMSTAKM